MDEPEVTIINEMSGSYLVGNQVASAALYNTVLRRAMVAEAERDGQREVTVTHWHAVEVSDR